MASKEAWKMAMEKDPKLKKLAIEAGCENDPERLNELKGAFAWNFGQGVCKTEAERELCMYLFCYRSNVNDAITGRMVAAREAGETEL